MPEEEIIESAPDLNLAEAEDAVPDPEEEQAPAEPAAAPEEAPAEPSAPAGASTPEPELPDWLRDEPVKPAQEETPPAAPAGGIDPETLKAVLTALASASEKGQAQGMSNEEVLARLLTDPASVLDERLNPLRQELEAVRRFTEMQTNAQLQILSDTAKQRLAEGFKREVVRHPLYSGDPEVKAKVDEIAMKALQDAVTSAMREGTQPLTEMTNPDYPLLLMTLGAYRAGKLRALFNGSMPTPETTKATAGMPASPGTAAKEQGTELPSEIDPATAQALRRIGITEEALRGAVSKYGWED